MKKAIIIICLVLSALLILDSMNVGHAAMMFLLAGVIPGTDMTLSAQHMMNLFALGIGVTLGRISAFAVRYLPLRALGRQRA